MLGAQVLGGSALGGSELPVEVTAVSVPGMASVMLWCDPLSDPGLPNPGRSDSLFYWKNWLLEGTSLEGPKVRLVRSVQWDDAAKTLTLHFDGRLSGGGRYRLQSLVARIDVFFTAVAADKLAGKLPQREMVIQDWAKPERKQDLQGGSLGTIQMLAGDLALTSGAAGLHERIVRLVETGVGEFVHDPTYGVDAREKGLMTVDALQRLQSRLLAGIRRQPDVVTAQVTVGQAPGTTDVVSVMVQADTVDGPLVVATEVGRR